MGEVVEMKKPKKQGVLFASDDTPAGFAALATADLRDAVKIVMGEGCPPNEVEDIAAQLELSGDVDFGDGWMAYRHGIEDVVVFLMEKLVEAVKDKDYEDGERAKALEMWRAAENRYAGLSEALTIALDRPRAEQFMKHCIRVTDHERQRKRPDPRTVIDGDA